MLLYNLPYSHLSLSSIAIALTALFCSPFKINENIIRSVITNVQLMGRFQIVSYKPTVILDVAHNPHATLHLSKQLKYLSKIGQVHAVMGVLKDKDIKNMIFNLIELIDFWYCAPINTKRGFTKEEMYNILPKEFNIFNTIKYAWMNANKKANKEDIILVFGSFLVVSEVIKFINDR